MKGRFKKFGFTVVELLTVVTVIAILLGLLIPALNMVRSSAKEAKQMAQFAVIDQTLMAFRNDHGFYPPSDNADGDYCGAQKLCEALLGWDLMGFHPHSGWTAGDVDRVYDLTGLTEERIKYNLNQRKGPYLELTTANAFRLGNIPAENKPGLFNNTGLLAPDTFVICDSFGAIPIRIGEKIVKAGMPILYYKANTSSKTISTGRDENRIYDLFDNSDLVELNYPQSSLLDGRFYSDVIRDPKVTARDWPYRADSYILISAGADGLYGTSDDITNF